VPMGAGPYSTASIAQHLRAAETPQEYSGKKTRILRGFLYFQAGAC